jgi:hypothetical protein
MARHCERLVLLNRPIYGVKKDFHTGWLEEIQSISLCLAGRRRSDQSYLLIAVDTSTGGRSCV